MRELNPGRDKLLTMVEMLDNWRVGDSGSLLSRGARKGKDQMSTREFKEENSQRTVYLHHCGMDE